MQVDMDIFDFIGGIAYVIVVLVRFTGNRVDIAGELAVAALSILAVMIMQFSKLSLAFFRQETMGSRTRIITMSKRLFEEQGQRREINITRLILQARNLDLKHKESRFGAVCQSSKIFWLSHSADQQLQIFWISWLSNVLIYEIAAGSKYKGMDMLKGSCCLFRGNGYVFSCTRSPGSSIIQCGGVTAAIIVFQPELECPGTLGQSIVNLFGWKRMKNRTYGPDHTEIVRTTIEMSKVKTGALIVLERGFLWESMRGQNSWRKWATAAD